MDDNQRRQLETLRETHQRHMQVLERQAAGFGDLYVPPHISTEIENLREKIADIERQLGTNPGPSPDTKPLPAIWNIPHPRNPNFTGRLNTPDVKIGEVWRGRPPKKVPPTFSCPRVRRSRMESSMTTRLQRI